MTTASEPLPDRSLQIVRNPILNWLILHPLVTTPLILALVVGLSFLIPLPEPSETGTVLVLLALSALFLRIYRPWRENKLMMCVPLSFALSSLSLLTELAFFQWLSWASVLVIGGLLLWRIRSENQERKARRASQADEQKASYQQYEAAVAEGRTGGFPSYQEWLESEQSGVHNRA